MALRACQADALRRMLPGLCLSVAVLSGTSAAATRPEATKRTVAHAALQQRAPSAPKAVRLERRPAPPKAPVLMQPMNVGRSRAAIAGIIGGPAPFGAKRAAVVQGSEIRRKH